MNYSSAINILCVFGFFLVGVITELLGRRKAITVATLPVTFCWVVIYFVQDKTLLLLIRILLGVSFGGVLMLVFVCVAEYQPPQIRAIFIILIGSVGSLVGTTLGHILSILLHWRYVALIGVIPSALSAILPLFCVESPPWLASKGRFEESKAAFNALRIPSEASENELRILLACEKKKQSTDAPKVVLGKKITVAIKQKYFWKILLFTFVLSIYRIASGRVLFSTLAITILQDITGTSDILYFTLVIDGFSILGTALSCYFLSKYKIRCLLFTSGILANVIQVVLSFCLYFFVDDDSYLSWVKVSVFALYFVIVFAGPYPILDTLISEVFPIEIKSFFLVLAATISGILQFLSIKLVPDMLLVMGYHGIFFLNSAIIFLCLWYLWYYLPETKGRSLHEIEYYFKNNTFNNSREFIKSEQIRDLLNDS